MTKYLIKKEFFLTAHPMTFVFAFFGAMLLIPSYPYYTAFFYATLGIFFGFMNGRENRDFYFSALLPVSKRQIVAGKCACAVIVELFAVIFSVPFAFISHSINPNGSNLAGIEANIAFYGLSLVMLALFNYVFLTDFFKTAYKVGIAFLKSSVVMFLFVAAAEIAAHIGAVGRYLDASDLHSQLLQLPILAAGVVIYALVTAAAVKKSIRNFEKADL